jgi:hypothetical protein
MLKPYNFLDCRQITGIYLHQVCPPFSPVTDPTSYTVFVRTRHNGHNGFTGVLRVKAPQADRSETIVIGSKNKHG